jgi:YD repeat-containing protein
MTDSFGRSLRFRYDASARLNKVIGLADEEYVYTADALGNVTSVRFPDGALRTYLYNEPARLANVPREGHLTGIIDENGIRSSTFTYDANGLAIATERAGGVDRYTFSGGQVTTPLGEQLNYTWNSNSGATRKLRATAVSRSCAGCTAATAFFSYDSNSNATSSTSFSGAKSCYAHDGRNRETHRLEGLSSGAECPADVAAYQIPSTPAAAGLQRKIWTQYHPDWRLTTRIAEPNRITTLVYNGQPDPTAGGTVRTCAPATATVIDNKPIAVVCRRIEQATTDATGNAGFAAAPLAGSPARVWAYSYNALGQLLTEDGPRTDVSDITTYSYHTTTTSDYTTGDLQSITNAVGRVTRFDKYNRHGQLLQSTDPNGVVTAYTYDLRQRLTSVTVGGQTTSYAYRPTGKLSRITRPGGITFVNFEYDDAERLRALSDQAGNRIDYTLDAAGNRTAEAIKDSANVLRRQLSRTFDAIGMLRSITGREF